MEFLELVKIRNRMCDESGGDCRECPLSSYTLHQRVNCHFFILDRPDKAEKIITDWAAAHPLKTRLQEFLEKYPKAKMNSDGEPEACCARLGYTAQCENDCVKCWDMPIEDE